MEMKFVYNSDQVAMYRFKTLRGFEQIIRDLLERHEKPYRLFISYKIDIASKTGRPLFHVG